MIKFLSSLVLIILVVPTYEQDTPVSPCPNVFTYEPPGSEPGRWYGVISLSTESTLHSLWLNIVLDEKADLLGNWIGEVTTKDNIDYKIENSRLKIKPGVAMDIKFFVQYNTLNPAPKVSAILLNGRAICGDNNPIPASDVLYPTQKPPQTTRTTIPTQPTRTTRPTQPTTSIRPTQPTRTNRPTYPTTIPPFNWNTQTEKESTGEVYSNVYIGIRPFIQPIRPETVNPPSQFVEESNVCGKVELNIAVPLVLNGTPTKEGQWPWQIALYKTQTVDNQYICGGTLVSHLHVITAAHCITRRNSNKLVDQTTLTVYLGKNNLRTSVNGVAVRFVEDIILHPEYNVTIYSRDLAILKLREAVKYSPWIKPACLWPENQISITTVLGKKGSVVGWGFDETGSATAELNLVEMPVVDTETCIRSYSEFFVRFTSSYTYCAGFRDGTSVCNGDSGGGMVFKMNNAWYLRGLVSLSVAKQNEFRCDPSHYVIFTDLAKFLPWIKENISDQ